jgi:hypothetical protein
MPLRGGPEYLTDLAERLLRDERAMGVEGVQELCRGVLELHRPAPVDPEAEHNHTPGDGRHKPYGAYVDGCPRCDALRAGKARPRTGWSQQGKLQEKMNAASREAHYGPGGPHQRGDCRPVCTFGDW